MCASLISPLGKRCMHVSTRWTPEGGSSSTMLMFGGWWAPNGDPTSNGTLVFGDLWGFNLLGGAWTQLVTTGSGPTPRAAPALAVWNGSLYLFGGSYWPDYTVMGDLYVLALSRSDAQGRFQWTALGNAAGGPAARFYGVFLPMPSKLVLASGVGTAGRSLFDVWAYDQVFSTKQKKKEKNKKKKTRNVEKNEELTGVAIIWPGGGLGLGLGPCGAAFAAQLDVPGVVPGHGLCLNSDHVVSESTLHPRRKRTVVSDAVTY